MEQSAVAFVGIVDDDSNDGDDDDANHDGACGGGGASGDVEGFGDGRMLDMSSASPSDEEAGCRDVMEALDVDLLEEERNVRESSLLVRDSAKERRWLLDDDDGRQATGS